MKQIAQKNYLTKVHSLGRDILLCEKLEDEKQFIQHGTVTTYEHSVRVAFLSLKIASVFGKKIDRKSLVRGALLHDYYLYDWHIPDSSHRLHGYIHARIALNNAERDFNLNDTERDIILHHMFPLNIAPPRHIEAVIVCFADKISAFCEMI